MRKDGGPGRAASLDRPGAVRVPPPEHRDLPSDRLDRSLMTSRPRKPAQAARHALLKELAAIRISYRSQRPRERRRREHWPVNRRRVE